MRRFAASKAAPRGPWGGMCSTRRMVSFWSWASVMVAPLIASELLDLSVVVSPVRLGPTFAVELLGSRRDALLAQHRVDPVDGLVPVDGRERPSTFATTVARAVEQLTEHFGFLGR